MQAIDIIRESAVAEGNKVKLTCGELPKDLYGKVNDVFSRFRGQWKGGKVAAHIFPEWLTGQAVIDSILAGQIPDRNPHSLFPTPDPVIDELIAELKTYLPDPENGQYRFLEPHGGTGAIARRLRQEFPRSTVDVVEIDPINIRVLKEQGFAPIHADFLALDLAGGYDSVVMNPPFNGTEYVDHIEKALTLVTANGCVVTVAPASLSFNSENKVLRLLDTIYHRCSSINELPAKSFKESGFNGDTVYFSIPGYVPTFIPFTGYSSRKTAILATNISCDRDAAQAFADIFKAHPTLTVDADDTPTDAKFCRSVKEIYTSYMHRNRMSYFVILNDVEWRELYQEAATDAEEHGVAIVRPERPKLVEPAPKQKQKRVEYNQISMFA